MWPVQMDALLLIEPAPTAPSRGLWLPSPILDCYLAEGGPCHGEAQASIQACMQRVTSSTIVPVGTCSTIWELSAHAALGAVQEMPEVNRAKSDGLHCSIMM